MILELESNLTCKLYKMEPELFGLLSSLIKLLIGKMSKAFLLSKNKLLIKLFQYKYGGIDPDK